VPVGPDRLHEIKYDGHRLRPELDVMRFGGNVSILSTNYLTILIRITTPSTRRVELRAVIARTRILAVIDYLNRMQQK
jgi:hypothetical protein